MLLRSQTLLSSARAMNFSPSQPEEAADLPPFDLQISIFITLACLVIPLILVLKPFGFMRTCFAWANVFLSRACSRAKVDDEESCSQKSAGGSHAQLPPIVEATHAPCDQASCPVSLPAETCASLRVMEVEGPGTSPSRNTLPLPDNCQSRGSSAPVQRQPPEFHRRSIISDVCLNALASTVTGQSGTLDDPEICLDAVQVSERTSVSALSRLEHLFDARSSACADGAIVARQEGFPSNYLLQDNTSFALRARHSPAALWVNQRHERQRRNADTTWSPELIFIANSPSELHHGSRRDLSSPLRPSNLGFARSANQTFARQNSQNL